MKGRHFHHHPPAGYEVFERCGILLQNFLTGISMMSHQGFLCPHKRLRYAG